MNASRMNPGVATRVAATRVLDAVLHRGRSLKATLAAALPALADSRDRALVEAIVFTALRQHARFDAALAQWLEKPPVGRDGELRALLYAGFAQCGTRVAGARIGRRDRGCCACIGPHRISRGW